MNLILQKSILKYWNVFSKKFWLQVMGMKRCGRCDLYTKIDPVDPLIIDLRVNTLTTDAQRDRDTVVAMRTLVFTALQRVQRTVHRGQDIGAPA